MIERYGEHAANEGYRKASTHDISYDFTQVDATKCSMRSTAAEF
jgi:hypothetical protein